MMDAPLNLDLSSPGTVGSIDIWANVDPSNHASGTSMLAAPKKQPKIRQGARKAELRRRGLR